MTLSIIVFPSPLGQISIKAEQGAITDLTWQDRAHAHDETPDELLHEARRQIDAYFAGRLTRFDLPLNPHGDRFQRAVCDEIARIPFGETRTYGEIAKRLGSMPQPVGQACGGNSIPIIIPCHRVTGTGNLGGFSGAGGVESKVALLKHEGAYSLLL